MTRRTALAFAPFLLSRRLLPAQAAVLQFMPGTESNVTLEVRKTGLMAGKAHTLAFTQFAGSASQEPPHVRFTVQSASLECRDTWLKPKDREKVQRYAIDDLLEAEKYPVLRFESTSVQPAEAGYSIMGNLTIRDQTRPVVVKAIGKAGDQGIVWTGGTTIRLTDFKLKPPTAALGSIGTEDDMALTFHLLSAVSA